MDSGTTEDDPTEYESDSSDGGVCEVVRRAQRRGSLTNPGRSNEFMLKRTSSRRGGAVFSDILRAAAAVALEEADRDESEETGTSDAALEASLDQRTPRKRIRFDYASDASTPEPTRDEGLLSGRGSLLRNVGVGISPPLGKSREKNFVEMKDASCGTASCSTTEADISEELHVSCTMGVDD